MNFTLRVWRQARRKFRSGDEFCFDYVPGRCGVYDYENRSRPLGCVWIEKRHRDALELNGSKIWNGHGFFLGVYWLPVKKAVQQKVGACGVFPVNGHKKTTIMSMSRYGADFPEKPL